MPLAHQTAVFAAASGAIAKLIADPANTSVPAAPSAPAAPGVAATGGAATVTYTTIDSNGVDSAASTAGTIATAIATTPTPGNPATITVSAVPAGHVYIIQRTSGANPGVVGKIGPGGTTLVDIGQPGQTYVANVSGVLYGPKVVIPGFKMMSLDPQIKEVILRGDYALLNAQGILESIRSQIQFAKLSTDALAVLLGGTVTDTGVTPNQVSTYSLSATSRFSYFKLEGASVAADYSAGSGDEHLVGWKCMCVASKTGLADDNFQLQDKTVLLIPRINDNRWLDMVGNETALAIAA